MIKEPLSLDKATQIKNIELAMLFKKISVDQAATALADQMGLKSKPKHHSDIVSVMKLEKENSTYPLKMTIESKEESHEMDKWADESREMLEGFKPSKTETVRMSISKKKMLQMSADMS